MLFASFKAASRAALSVAAGELHFVKNANPKNVAMITGMCLKACIQRGKALSSMGIWNTTVSPLFKSKIIIL